MKRTILAALCVLALSACGDREAEQRAAAQAQAAAQEEAAAALAREYDAAVTGQNWDLARVHGAALLSQYPDSQAAQKMKAGYEEVKAKGETARERRRLEGLWNYSQSPQPKGGTQRSATIYGRNRIDLEGRGETQVQLVFRDHPQWKRSAYLVLQASDFHCKGGCKVKVTADGKPRAMDASRADTNEAIAMFITDHKALWKLLRKSQVVEIEFPVKAGGTRKVSFDTGGLDGSQMPGWD
ncbi:hypothetical protein DT603_06795 [Pseudoxanthomonas gei]|uniref:Lipoprotein n=1 Tax=Pseudoxanthomonas gei TaxID=1383030 RepID=A0ABX0AEG1_9GAMM|nr:hypothetical protein [Pseudoxanthomonas gei]NDK38550.1 hypothetical protein [Pseudoxanthomonas gei]